MEGEAQSFRLGLHWGDRHACLSVYRNGKVEMIPDLYGNRVIPMYLAYCGSKILFGQRARSYARDHPDLCFSDFGELISLTWKEHSNVSLQKEWNRFAAAATAICGAAGGDEERSSEAKLMEPTKVAIAFLRELRLCAERYLHRHARWFSCRTTIVVPAHFDQVTTRAVESVASSAGFSVTQIITEPLAAAVAFGLNVQCRSRRKGRLVDEKKCVVFSFGARVSEATVLKSEDGIVSVMESARQTDLGSDTFTEVIASHFASEFFKVKKTEIRSRRALAQLWVQADLVRRQLARSSSARMCLCDDGIEYQCVIRRSTFEALNTANYGRCLALLREALHKAQITKEDVESLIIMGQEARMPKFQQLLQSYMTSESFNLVIAPDQLIDLVITSTSTAIQDNFTLLPLTPSSIEKVWSPTGRLSRCHTARGDEGFVRTPRSSNTSRTTTTFFPHVANPYQRSDFGGATPRPSSHQQPPSSSTPAGAVGEIAAYGAAIQAASRMGDCSSSVIPVAVVPIAVGICDQQDGLFVPVVTKGSPIPLSTSTVVHRTADAAGRLRLVIYESERKFVAYGKQIGAFELQLVPLAVAEITLTFFVNGQGDLTVSCDLQPWKTHHAVLHIPRYARASREEIDDMVHDAQANRLVDMQRSADIQSARTRLQAKHEFETCLSDILSQIENCPETPKREDEWRKLDDLIQGLKEWLEHHQEASADQFDFKAIALRKQWRASCFVPTFPELVEAGFAQLLRNPILL